jgi:hypothetical protein
MITLPPCGLFIAFHPLNRGTGDHRMSARLATAAALSASDREEAMAEVRQLITDLRRRAGRP